MSRKLFPVLDLHAHTEVIPPSIQQKTLSTEEGLLNSEVLPLVLFFLKPNTNYFIYLFIYCCSSTLVSICHPPLLQPQPSSPPSPDSTPLGFFHVFFIVVHENPSSLSPHCPLPPPLWLQSVCSQFQCLWLYVACLFVLLIRFHS